MNPKMNPTPEKTQTTHQMCSQLLREQLQVSLSRKLEKAQLCLANGQTEMYNAWMNLVRSLEILIKIKQAALAR